MNTQKIIIIVGILALAGGLIYYFSNNKKTNSENNKTEPKLEVYNIADDSLGISFQIPKEFTRIDSGELKNKNPFFIYGFKPEGVDDAACYVSQTKRSGEGEITAEYLRNGAFSEIKKTYPDAQGLNSHELDLGEEITGVVFDAGYKEGETDMIQRELVAATSTRTTFAFCAFPKSLSEIYQTQFDMFFDSFKIK